MGTPTDLVPDSDSASSCFSSALPRFIEQRLKQKDGAVIRASVLYDLCRSWLRMEQRFCHFQSITEPSDVKLAELFSSVPGMLSKRLSCGKVWTGYELQKDDVWHGPTAWQTKTIWWLPTEGAIDTRYLGSALRNIRITGTDDINDVIRICVDNAIYDLDYDGGIFYTPKDLWLTQCFFSQIILLVPNTLLKVQYECSEETPESGFYNYYNETRGWKFYVDFCFSKLTSLQPPADRKLVFGAIRRGTLEQVKRGVVFGIRPASPVPKPEPTYTSLPEVFGLRGVSCENTAPARKFYCLQLNSDYMIIKGVPYTEEYFPYILETPEGFQQCLRLRPLHWGNAIILNDLDGTSLPEHLITVTCNGQPVHKGNVISASSYELEYRTKFYTQGKPSARNIFEHCTLTADVIRLSDDVRDRAPPSPPSIHNDLNDYLKNVTEYKAE